MISTKVCKVAEGNSRKLEPGEILYRERERTLASGVRKLVSQIYSLERAFEEVRCSCSPYREQLKELQGRYDAERKRLMDELDSSELGRQLSETRKTIYELDHKEHPQLDAIARRARPFMAVWIMDQLRDENPDILDLNEGAIAKAYAQAWVTGWRPRSLGRGRGAYQES